MDSPPECVLALSCEPPVSPSMPSLDHSPLAAAEPSLQSSATPSPQSPTDGSLSPFPGLLNHQLDSTTAAIVNGEALEDELEGLHEELEEEEEEAMSAPPSPTPAVALFPGEGAGVVSGPPPPRESPPGSPPSVPSVAGFVALEMALSASSTTTAGAQCGEDDGELDLQLFHRDATITSAASAPSVTTGGAAAAALRFPCNVCGKRFRFQSILSLHARAHRLDRQRRATVLYHAGRDACKPPQHAPLDQLQERNPMTNQECSTDQSTLKNLETNLERSQDGRSPDACLENNPERRRNRRKRTMDRRPEPRLDQRVDLNFGTSPAGSLESSPREVIHHEDSHQNTFSPHFMSDPFQSPSLTPPPTKEAPIMAAFTPLLPSHFEDAAQTVDVSAAAGVTAAASSFRCNECKGKFRTASELARHTRILHNPYKCTMCPFSASQEERLATHLRDSHPAPSVTAPHEHQVAPSTAKSTTSLPFSPQRTRENPTPPELPVTITALNASANASVNASAASSQVSGGAPLPAFRCETCGQRFTQSWFLKGHMRKHKDSLDHKCQVCGRGFKEPWFLKNHMKVHLNKLGLKAGLAGLGLSPVPGGGELTGKSSGGAGGSRGKNQSLSALYSSLLLARTGAGGAGGAGAGVFGGGVGGGAGSRAERELATAVAAATAAAAAAATGSASGSSKASILSYLGLPGAEGASCVERLQAVAQVAEMGNGERRERERDRDRERTREERPEATHGGGGGSDAADQAAMWQLVARSLAAAQHSHHQQQQQQQQQKARSRPHQPHQPLSQPRGSVAGEAEQLRAYLGGLGGPGTGSSGGGGRERDDHHLVTASSGSSGMGGSEASLGGPWECPDCGKLFRSLQQVVAHARVHLQKPHKGHQRDEESLLRGGGGGGGGGEGGARRGGSNSSSGGGGVTNSSSESRTEPKLSKTRTGMAGGFHSLLAPFSGENGLRGVAAGSSLAPRERVRGKGMKDCPYCGKAFRSSHHLKVHLRVHTGERPYKCPHCDYAGTQSGSLKYHLQRHHREQQRNALASSSPGLPTLPLPPRSNESSNVPKQRLAQSLAQLGVFGRTGVATTTPTDSQTVTSRHSQAWARANQEEKSPKGSATSDAAAAAAAAALKEGDLERQYHFLSGVMGALYQGRLPEASWLGELGGQGPPPAKQPKVSRRKPLTTSRMVPTNGHGGGGGRVPSSLSPSPPLHGRTQEGGFEPLDLSSRRTLPEMDGGERRRKREASGGERRQGAEGGGRGGGGGGGGGAGAVTLTQCLFCPFRTSSAELMAMHLQVNHTSKSRRKRSSPLPLPAAAPATSPAPPSTTSSVPATTTAPEPDQLALWRYISGQDEVPSVPTFQDDQTLFVTRAPPRENGLGLEDEEEEDELEQDEEEELLQHEIDEDGDLASDTYEPSVSSTLHEKEEEEIGEGMGEMDEEEEEEEEEDEDERKKKNMKSGRMERLEALHAVLSGRSPGGRGAASPRIEEGTVGD